MAQWIPAHKRHGILNRPLRKSCDSNSAGPRPVEAAVFVPAVAGSAYTLCDGLFYVTLLTVTQDSVPEWDQRECDGYENVIFHVFLPEMITSVRSTVGCCGEQIDTLGS